MFFLGVYCANKNPENTGKLKSAKEVEKNISIAHDMTREERQNNKDLVEEAKKCQNDESGDWLHRMVGPPSDRKIIKVKKK